MHGFRSNEHAKLELAIFNVRRMTSLDPKTRIFADVHDSKQVGMSIVQRAGSRDAFDYRISSTRYYVSRLDGRELEFLVAKQFGFIGNNMQGRWKRQKTSNALVTAAINIMDVFGAANHYLGYGQATLVFGIGFALYTAKNLAINAAKRRMDIMTDRIGVGITGSIEAAASAIVRTMEIEEALMKVRGCRSSAERIGDCMPEAEKYPKERFRYAEAKAMSTQLISRALGEEIGAGFSQKYLEPISFLMIEKTSPVRLITVSPRELYSRRLEALLRIKEEGLAEGSAVTGPVGGVAAMAKRS